MHRSLHDSPPEPISSPIHRLNPAVKVGAALTIIILIVSVPARHIWLLSGIALLIFVIAFLSRVSTALLTRRLLMLEPLAFGVAILSLFQPGGWQAFVLIVSRCTLCFITAILLSATTPVTELVQVLRKVRVPSLLITTMLLMHRYLFVLLDESQRMRRARASRTFVKRRHLEWRTMATIIGQLFIRSVERAERVYAAMAARGWP